MSTTIESLELEIQANSKSAVSGIEALTLSLGKLKKATSGGLGLGSIATNLRSISQSANSIGSKSINNVSGLARAVDLLGKAKITTNISRQITSISDSLRNADFSGGKAKIESLVTVLSPLSSMPKSNLSSFITPLKKLPQIFEDLKKLDMPALSSKIQELATAFKPLGDEMERVSNGFSTFPARLQMLLRETNKMTESNKKAAMSFTDLFHVISSVARGIERVGKIIWSAVDKSMDYTENMNLFSVSMGQYASDAMEYAEQVSDAMGVDTSEWVRNQGIFMTMATGFGVAGDRAALMSKNLTQLGYDLSSFYNIDVETAMLKLKSGLAGELEPLRAIGYDLSQAKLEATALELGITKSVSAMTQAEKAQLRYYAIMTQVTDAHGDLARTLDDPANQVRVLKAQFNMAAREIGNIFIPVLQTVVPYLTAAAKVVRILASSIAGLFGYEAPDVFESTSGVVENTDAITENLQDAQEEARKLKSYMLGFDELNVINPNTDTEDSSGWVDFELPDLEDKFWGQLGESRVNQIVEDMKEWLGITEDIDTWGEFFNTKLGAIITSIGIAATGLAGWKIAEGVEKTVESLTNWTDAKTRTLGVTLAITGIVIGSMAIQDAVAEGLDGVNLTVLIGAGGALTAGAALIGKSFGKTLIGAAIGGIITGVAGLGVGLYDAISKELNITNGLTIAFSTALLGLSVAAFIPKLAAGMGLIMGAIVGAAIAGSVWLIQNTDDTIAQIGSVLSGAALAVGAVLAFTGVSLPLGIALMAMGAVSMGTAIAMNTDALNQEVKDVIAIITSGVSMALLAVGAVLAFTGTNIPLGIALMAGGAVTMGTAIIPNWNGLSDAAKGAVSLVTAIISGAALAVGAIFAFSAANIPLGIALMAIGAAGLATTVALNWDAIVGALQSPIGLITGLIGGALLVLGAILLFTGAGIPLGIGLMVAGAGGIAAPIAANWNFLTDKIKEIWNNIAAFWNTYIAPVFTAEWWEQLGKDCINGLIGGFESGINGIIGAFESMINWIVDGLNTISIDIPDWLGGGSWGINIPRVGFGRVSIPRYAEGGFPEQGQMFIAREAGAEMVGSIGRKTAVANNDQIVSGIAGGVAEANEEQNVLLREQNSLLRALLEKDSSVYLDGKNLTHSVEKYQRERGRVLITGGVM